MSCAITSERDDIALATRTQNDARTTPNNADVI